MAYTPRIRFLVAVQITIQNPDFLLSIHKTDVGPPIKSVVFATW